MKTLLILIATPLLACHLVDSSKILGRDFALADPAFASLDPSLAITTAPIPGVTRTFHAEEIARIARSNNINIAPPIALAINEMCFERATESLTEEKLLPALHSALALDDARIEILDFSRSPVPRGTIAFSKSGLSAAGMWRGHVTYDDSRTVAIWARVRVTVERTWIEAAQPIAAGTLIDSSELVVKSGPRFPFETLPIASVDLIAARKAVRSIRAGEPIFAPMLMLPRDIERGDTVRVSVSSGGALLEFDGVAQAPARIGESVLIKNPESNRYFQARVQDKGKVSITK